jgi:hypothetical protein
MAVIKEPAVLILDIKKNKLMHNYMNLGKEGLFPLIGTHLKIYILGCPFDGHILQ